MAVTFDMNEAKKATEVVIEVTEIVNVECFKVALTILTNSSSPNFLWCTTSLKWLFVFDVVWCSISECSSSFILLIAFEDWGFSFLLSWALAHWLVHALTNMKVSSAPTPSRWKSIIRIRYTIFPYFYFFYNFLSYTVSIFWNLVFL